MSCEKPGCCKKQKTAAFTGSTIETTSATTVHLRFGPQKEYVLQIPVTGPIAKKELAESLRKMANTLDPIQDPSSAQLPLPFEQ